MNLEWGVQVLKWMSKDGTIDSVLGLETFRASELPDFRSIYGEKPITVVLSRIHHGWQNASLAEEVVKAYDTLEGGGATPPYRTKKFNLTAPSAHSFVDDALRQFNNASRLETTPDSILGASYQSWDPAATEQSYILLVSKEGGTLNYNLQVAAGNPNGWDFKPVHTAVGTSSDFSDPLHTQMILQGQKIFLRCQRARGERFPVIIEGRVVRDYVRDGPVMIATDLYEAADNATNKTDIGHAGHITSYVINVMNGR